MDEKKINWKCYQETGAPVLLLEKDKEPRGLKNFSDLDVGMELLVPSLFGYVKAMVNGAGMAETDTHLYNLTFDKDRGWCSDLCMNKAAIARLELYK